MSEAGSAVLVGIALVPERAILSTVVAFARRWGYGFGGLRLDGERVLPHVSLHQLWTRDLAPVVEAFEGLDDRQCGTTRIADLIEQPPDWIFATVETAGWLVDRQVEILERFGRLFDASLLKGEDQLGAYTDEERNSYLRHGYRYVGDAFLPHFTLGRSVAPGRGVAPESQDDFAERLGGATVSFDRMVLFRAGSGGSIAEIVAEIA